MNAEKVYSLRLKNNWTHVSYSSAGHWVAKEKNKQRLTKLLLL